jgi:hypothetical protein
MGRPALSTTAILSLSMNDSLPCFERRPMPPLRLPRKIEGLCSAWLATRPAFLPSKGGRRTAAQKQGFAYEKKVWREIKRWAKEQGLEPEFHRWIQFIDSNGDGWCEPEGWVELPDGRLLLFEAKLTGTELGKLQMEWLYAPLLRNIFERKVICLHVCKWRTDRDPGPSFESPSAFVASGKSYGSWNFVA